MRGAKSNYELKVVNQANKDPKFFSGIEEENLRKNKSFEKS